MTPEPIPIRRLVLLLGFMGAGKTTVGQRLARRLGWTFVDLDEEIERRQGRTIARIFDQHGEPYFRRVEHEVLEDILREAEGRATVVALGGGTYAQPENFDRLRRNGGVAIWLDCSLEELRRRCRGLTHRPLFRDPAGFRRLYDLRRPYYEKADLRVEASGRDPDRVVEEILQCGLF